MSAEKVESMNYNDDEIPELLRLSRMEMEVVPPSPPHHWPWHKRLARGLLRLQERVEAGEFALSEAHEYQATHRSLLVRAQEVLRKIDAIITPESSPYSEDEEPDTSTCVRCHNLMDHRGGDGYECDVCVQELFGLIREAFPKSEARRFLSDLDSALKGGE